MTRLNDAQLILFAAALRPNCDRLTVSSKVREVAVC